MEDLKELIKDAKRVLIAGHRRPDGDCTGACIAAYHYLKENFPDRELMVYLEVTPERFSFLDEDEEIISHYLPEEPFELVIALDSSTADCLGMAQKAFEQAERTVCIDHHISNASYAGQNFIDASASSTCEVLYGMMDEKAIGKETAAALYIGIVFDTGVFRYSNTSKKTMEIAGKLMAVGIPFYDYIDKCIYEKTYTQIQLLGRTLLTSMRLMDGICIVAVITKRMMEFYGAKTEDIEGIIEQLRITKGVEVAILLHETGEQEYKVSLRSNHYIDVSKIASFFNGGGHIRAAGCNMQGSMHDVVNNLTEHIETQMKGLKV